MSGFFSMFSSPSMPDIEPAPVLPSTADQTAKKAKEYARKRTAGQQGIEDTMLTGSVGIEQVMPGLKSTLG